MIWVLVPVLKLSLENFSVKKMMDSGKPWQADGWIRIAKSLTIVDLEMYNCLLYVSW